MPLRRLGNFAYPMELRLPLLPFLAPRILTNWLPSPTVTNLSCGRSGRRALSQSRHADELKTLADSRSSTVSVFKYEERRRWWGNALGSLESVPMPGQNYQNIQMDEDVEMWVENYFNQSRTDAQILSWWRGLEERHQERLWPQIMIYFLHKDPNHAIRFLRLTNNNQVSQWRYVKESLHFLIKYFLEMEGPSAVEMQSLVSLMLLSITPRRTTFHLNQSTIKILLQRISSFRHKELLDVLVRKHILLSENTILQFINSYAKIGEIDRARTLLNQLMENNREFARDRYYKAYSSLLAGSSYDVNVEVLADMVRNGVNPTIIAFNIVMNKAFEADNYAAGWQVFFNLKQSGLSPDAYTFSTLLNGAMKHGDDKAIDSIANHLAQNKELENNPWLITDLMYARYKVMERKRRRSGFKEMLEMFETYFDTSILEALRVLPTVARISNKENAKPQPPTHAIRLVLAAFLRRGISLENLLKIIYIYQQRVLRGDPTFVSLAESNYVSNTLLKALGSSLEGIKHCEAFISFMLRVSSASLSAAVPQNMSTFIPVKLEPPTALTWNILAHSYIRCRMPVAAEEVIQRMEGEMCHPDKVTWDGLISGYGRMQRVDGAVKALRSMVSEGWEIDQWTLNGLGRIVDRKQLFAALEESDVDVPDSSGRIESTKLETPVGENSTSSSTLDARYQKWLANTHEVPLSIGNVSEETLPASITPVPFGNTSDGKESDGWVWDLHPKAKAELQQSSNYEASEQWELDLEPHIIKDNKT